VFALLGCGYTGERVARRLLARGLPVLATSRQPERLRLPGARLLRVDLNDPVTLEDLREALPAGVRVLHSVPLVRDAGGAFRDPTPELLACLPTPTERVVYLSTTGVYGGVLAVDETTPPAPRTPRETLRVSAENQVLAGPWSSLVLRPAAIYGPGRGIHVSMRRGDFRLLGEGENFVSRIHVDDLAALAEAALLSEVKGAWPVADLRPAQSREIAAFCANLLGCPLPASASARELSETRRANRRVDGRAITEILGVRLAFPTYREGIPQALAAEAAETQSEVPGPLR
jgi:nucleoside-diphosphate-sugar epimerase